MRNSTASTRFRAAISAWFFLASILLSGAGAHAAIEKVGRPNDRGLDLMWWPKVVPPVNWIHDSEVSYENHINMFVPKGETFVDSPVVMYTRAVYFEKEDTTGELEDAIRNDQSGFLEHFPDAAINEVEMVKTGDGTGLRTFSFTPKSSGSWELVAYGREPNYVIFFCISAKTKAALEKNRAAFLFMVRSYTSRDE